MKIYSEWIITVFGVTVIVTSQLQQLSFHDVIKQFLITMSDKHRNSPVVNDNVNFCSNFLRAIVRTPLNHIVSC